VNLDRGNVWGSTSDVIMLGAAQSELERFATAAAEREHMRPLPESRDGTAFFYRADHLPFAQSGVPVLALQQGSQFLDRASGWGPEQERQYLISRYHRASDEFTADFVFGGLLQQVRLAVRLSWMLGTTDAFPSWTPSSEFKAAGEQQRIRRLRDSGRSTDRR